VRGRTLEGGQNGERENKHLDYMAFFQVLGKKHGLGIVMFFYCK